MFFSAVLQASTGKKLRENFMGHGNLMLHIHLMIVGKKAKRSPGNASLKKK